MESLVYHTLDFIAEKSGYAEYVLDMTVPNIDGYNWKDNWSADAKAGPDSILYHALDIIAEKSKLVDRVLDTITLSPKIEGYGWRHYWDEKDN